MNKKNKPIPQKETVAPKPTRKDNNELVAEKFPIEPIDGDSIWSKLTQGWIPYIIMVVLGLGLYVNTFHHEFALDDDIIVCKNEHVLKGLGGMGDILTKDVFDSYYKSMNLTAQLAGGRYRPFSVATYAIEQEFIGTMPVPDSVSRIEDEQKRNVAMQQFLPRYFAGAWDLNKNNVKDPQEDINKDGLFTDRDFKVKGTTLRHVNNVLLYLLGTCIIYLFLSRFFFKENKLLALLASLLFLAHPLHTEVVANMKSRDEILSLLFMVLTLYFSFVFVESKDKKHIIIASICYFVGLLSKEYGATLLVLVPLSLYVYYKKLQFSDIFILMGGLLVSFGIYYALRSGVVLDISDSSVQDSELLNNPYLNATESQASATKTFINLKYFILLLFPYAMSSDYSYSVIPYKDWTDIEVILSVLLLIGSAVGLFLTIRKRSWLAFPIAFAIAHLVLVNNMFFNIGATMGERLVYHTSLGTCILMVYGVYYLFTRVFKMNANLIALVLLPIVALYSFKTIARNPAWKNDYTLTMTDVKTYPNSIMLNGNACNRLIEMSEFPKNKEVANKFLDSAANYGRKALLLHPGYVTTYMNMGMIKFKQNDYDSASHFWDNVIRLFPTHPNVPQIRLTLLSGFSTKANEYSKSTKFNEALAELLKAYKYVPNNPKLCYDIGNMYSVLQNPTKAREFFSIGLKYAPGDPNLLNGMNR